MHNQGQEFLKDLSKFFENLLKNAALTYTLETLDKYHDSLCKVLQIAQIPKKSSRGKESSESAAQTSVVELEAKVRFLKKSICIGILYINFIGMLFY